MSDRLAYLNFVHGTIASTLAGKLDASRATFKELRNAENNLTPKRNLRYSLKNQIARIKADNQRGMEKRLAELEKQLAQAEEDDEALEKEVSLLKRRALAESEREKWAAIREVSCFSLSLRFSSNTSCSMLRSLSFYLRPLHPSSVHCRLSRRHRAIPTKEPRLQQRRALRCSMLWITTSQTHCRTPSSLRMPISRGLIPAVSGSRMRPSCPTSLLAHRTQRQNSQSHHHRRTQISPPLLIRRTVRLLLSTRRT